MLKSKNMKNQMHVVTEEVGYEDEEEKIAA